MGRRCLGRYVLLLSFGAFWGREMDFSGGGGRDKMLGWQFLGHFYFFWSCNYQLSFVLRFCYLALKS